MLPQSDERLILGIVQADTRGRVPLKKYTLFDVKAWRISRSPDGRTLALEAVDQ